MIPTLTPHKVLGPGQLFLCFFTLSQSAVFFLVVITCPLSLKKHLSQLEDRKFQSSSSDAFP